MGAAAAQPSAVFTREAEEYKKVQEIFKSSREAARCLHKRLLQLFQDPEPDSGLQQRGAGGAAGEVQYVHLM